MELATNNQPTMNKQTTKSPSPFTIARRKFLKNKIAMVSLVIFILIVLSALIAPFVLSADIKRVDFLNINKPPSSKYWLGTDANGRDILTRTLYGGRISLLVGVLCTLFVVLIGTTVGSIAGFFGGFIDKMLMRFTDFVLIFPFLIFAIVINTILAGKIGGPWPIIIVISLLSWGGVARIVRSRILAEKENEYILAAISIGCKPSTIIVKHLIPNVLSTIIVQATLLMAVMIVVESGLSFIGFGIPSDTPTWGNMLSEARQSDVLRNKVWMWLPPAAMITLTILCINFIGEGLKDAFNPKSRR